MLSKSAIKRYQRQINLSEIGLSGQQRLQQARVLCVGLGGLGSPLCLYLTACGIGQLGLIDADRVDISNLHRQILYRTDDCGKTKTEVANNVLQQTNPDCQLIVYDEYLTEHNARDILVNYDIIADCTDNFSSRYLISDACVSLDKTYVMASVNQFEGQLAVFPGRAGPCYRCLFEVIDHNIVPTCNQAGVLGTTPGVLGILQANEILKLILKVGKPTVGKLVSVNLLDLSTKLLTINQNPRCPACVNYQDLTQLHRPPFRCANLHDIAAITIEQLNDLRCEKNDVHLIDVRSSEEYQQGYLPKAINIPLPELSHSIKHIDRENVIIVYCETSPRSIVAYQLLKKLKFQEVYYLEGGYSQAGVL